MARTPSGILDRFIGEPSVRLAVAEAAGDGIATGRHAAALAGGTPGILHGSRSLMLQDRDGQVVEAHSISAGLDYPGVGPQIAALVTAGRLELAAATDAEALAGASRPSPGSKASCPRSRPPTRSRSCPRLLAGVEGSGVAVPGRDASSSSGFSGRGDKDLGRLEPGAEGARVTAAGARATAAAERRPRARTTTAGARRIAAAFAAARADGRAALVPYIVAGYPDADDLVPVALAAADAGADLLEVGLPYSDPLADGATLQRASRSRWRQGRPSTSPSR